MNCLMLADQRLKTLPIKHDDDDDRPFINKIHFAVKWLNYVNKLFTTKIYEDNLKIYYMQWLIMKLSLNLFVLQTGAAKARVDLRL